MRWIVVALAGCAEPPAPLEPEVITITNVVTVTNIVTVTNPKPPTPCDLREPGYLCTWVGIPGLAQLSPEGLPRLEAGLYLPTDVSMDPNTGSLHVVDWNNHRIRVVDGGDRVVTVAGTGNLGEGILDPEAGTWSAGPALEYALNRPTRLAFDPRSSGAFTVAVWGSNRVVRYEDGYVEPHAGTGASGYGDGDPDGDGVHLATDAVLNNPSAVAYDESGVLYVMDQENQIVRAVATDGTIEVLAGVPKAIGHAGDGGDAALALMFQSTGGASDPSGGIAVHDGALYFADTENHVIRRVDLTTRTITTYAGVFEANPAGIDLTGDGVSDIFPGILGYEGDGGPATEARLNRPRDLAFGPDGSLYVADTGNHCIRVVTPDGVIDTFAGVCEESGSQANRLAREGRLDTPFGVEVDAAGNVFIADTYNHVIRVVWATP